MSWLTGLLCLLLLLLLLPLLFCRYPATIHRRTGPDCYTLHYDDGTMEKQVPASRMRLPLPAPPQHQHDDDDDDDDHDQDNATRNRNRSNRNNSTKGRKNNNTRRRNQRAGHAASPSPSPSPRPGTPSRAQRAAIALEHRERITSELAARERRRRKAKQREKKQQQSQRKKKKKQQRSSSSAAVSRRVRHRTSDSQRRAAARRLHVRALTIGGDSPRDGGSHSSIGSGGGGGGSGGGGGGGGAVKRKKAKTAPTHASKRKAKRSGDNGRGRGRSKSRGNKNSRRGSRGRSQGRRKTKKRGKGGASRARSRSVSKSGRRGRNQGKGGRTGSFHKTPPPAAGRALVRPEPRRASSSLNNGNGNRNGAGAGVGAGAGDVPAAQVWNPTLVTCPTCAAVLVPPQHAPVFACPCGQHIMAPTPGTARATPRTPQPTSSGGSGGGAGGRDSGAGGATDGTAAVLFGMHATPDRIREATKGSLREGTHSRSSNKQSGEEVGADTGECAGGEGANDTNGLDSAAGEGVAAANSVARPGSVHSGHLSDSFELPSSIAIAQLEHATMMSVNGDHMCSAEHDGTGSPAALSAAAAAAHGTAHGTTAAVYTQSTRETAYEVPAAAASTTCGAAALFCDVVDAAATSLAHALSPEHLADIRRVLHEEWVWAVVRDECVGWASGVLRGVVDA